jgi:hypothetical protein
LSSAGKKTKFVIMPKTRAVVPIEVVAKHFRFPIDDAAKILGVCVNVLKQTCRQQGLAAFYSQISELNSVLTS